MTAFLCLLLSVRLLSIANVPAGSKLQVRMNDPVGSWSSKVGNPISAVLIAPVFVNGELALPAGSTLSGRISSVTRVGLGIFHERASLGLEFLHLTLPGGETREMAARVTQVDNGRERVISTGAIQGIRATGSISYRVSGYIKTLLLWHFHAQLAEWAIKSLVVQLPEPEIYYPAGTELTLSVQQQSLSLAPGNQNEPVENFDDSDGTGLNGADLNEVVSSLPSRTMDPESGRPSDLTNILLAGSRGEIAVAFQAAGWSLARPLGLRSRIEYIRAAAETRGYSAPMKSLLLNGAEADMCWQKGLNDVSKRHHVRIWKQPGLWKGQELWIGAATHDVEFAYLRPGRTFTHRIDPNVDEEREKVAYDLAFTSCASPVIWMDRPEVPRFAHNGTGDVIVTDSRLVVVRVSECSLLPPANDAASPATLIARGGKWQRLARREILMARSDLIRANLYWRTYEGVRLVFDRLRERRQNLQARSLATEMSPLESSPRRQAFRLALSALQ